MNVPKANDEHYICSVFCYDINDYPYSPFIAKSVDNAICQYLIMAINEKSIFCPNPELHIIGTALIKKGKILQVKPSKYVYRIDTENFHAKQLYYTVQLKKKVKRLLNRFTIQIQSFLNFVKKNLKEELVIERINENGK